MSIYKLMLCGVGAVMVFAASSENMKAEEVATPVAIARMTAIMSYCPEIDVTDMAKMYIHLSLAENGYEFDDFLEGGKLIDTMIIQLMGVRLEITQTSLKEVCSKTMKEYGPEGAGIFQYK